MAAASVRDNKAKSRFELDVEGAVAFANYRLTPSSVIITHTETPRALRGRGIASELVQGALQLIRAEGLKVVAGCGFVVDYLQKHPEFSDLAGGVRRRPRPLRHPGETPGPDAFAGTTREQSSLFTRSGSTCP